MMNLFFSIFFLLIISSESVPIKKKSCKQDTHIEPSRPRGESKNKIRNSYDNLLIDVVFSVFHNDNDGKVSKNVLKNQISVMNNAFSGTYSKQSMIDTNIRFKINKINYINNNNYYKNCDSTAFKMTKLYSINNDQNINIIICESQFYLGWAYLPWAFSEINKMNAIFISTISLPNKNYNVYNLGMTSVHEVGHYFGLLHTFSESYECVDGDMISDTPVEKYPSFTCGEKNTCPEHDGNDPITNYMDYSPDECMFEFTFLQINRMWDMIDRYKPKLKMKSENNYIRSKNIVSYYKKGGGLCVDKLGGKLESININNKGNYISHTDCKQKINQYNSFAYTFINDKDAKEKNLKYNCFIHKTNSINNIKNGQSIDKNKFKKANCYIIKLIPKTTVAPHTTNLT